MPRNRRAPKPIYCPRCRCARRDPSQPCPRCPEPVAARRLIDVRSTPDADAPTDVLISIYGNVWIDEAGHRFV